MLGTFIMYIEHIKLYMKADKKDGHFT